MKKIFVVSFIAASIKLAGCTTIPELYESARQHVIQNQFESTVEESQEYVLEAKLLISEGNIKEAKEYLDKAYSLYPRQASLHKTYKQYYEITGNDRLAKLASQRFDAMVVKSNALNKKGHVAMTEMDSLVLAEKLFTLSLIYHDENTATLMNIATLGYTTGDFELASSSLKMLNRLGHMSPESQLLSYLMAKRMDDQEGMQITKFIMRVSWPDSRQYKFIQEHDESNVQLTFS